MLLRPIKDASNWPPVELAVLHDGEQVFTIEKNLRQCVLLLQAPHRDRVPPPCNRDFYTCKESSGHRCSSSKQDQVAIFGEHTRDAVTCTLCRVWYSCWSATVVVKLPAELIVLFPGDQRASVSC